MDTRRKRKAVQIPRRHPPPDDDAHPLRQAPAIGAVEVNETLGQMVIRPSARLFQTAGQGLVAERQSKGIKIVVPDIGQAWPVHSRSAG